MLGRRCTAEVSLETQQKGSGYVGHPAVTDSCMQMGPVTACQGTPNNEGMTRVVASLSAFCVRSDSPALTSSDKCARCASAEGLCLL